MSRDDRLFPANDRVVLAARAAEAPDRTPVAPAPHAVIAPLADLRLVPEGGRARQLVFGARFEVLEMRDAHAFGIAAQDGHVGWVAAAALAPWQVAPTHRVAARATYALAAPDIKAPEALWLSYGSRLAVTGTENGFARCRAGFVPLAHLAPLAPPAADPVAEAERLLGTPYLWGGNSAAGIDCSGLVQAALLACGRPCPPDSDLQEAAFADRPARGAPQRGDLMFWKGHVALVRDAETLIHANAHASAVAIEPIAGAVARIAQQGGGPVTLHARP